MGVLRLLRNLICSRVTEGRMVFINRIFEFFCAVWLG